MLKEAPEVDVEETALSLARVMIIVMHDIYGAGYFIQESSIDPELSLLMSL